MKKEEEKAVFGRDRKKEESMLLLPIFFDI